MLQEKLSTLCNPLYPLARIWHFRYFLLQMTLRGVQTRFKGSFLGVLWLVLSPLLMLAIYSFVFSVIFRARWGGAAMMDNSRAMFALMLFCGMSVFNVFSESVNPAPRAITDRVNFVKKIIAPVEQIPLATVGSAFLIGLLWFVILLVFIFIEAGFRLPLSALWLPVLLMPLVLLAAGVVWFAASLGVYIRDLAQVVPIAVQILFFLTPVFYSLDMVPAPYRFWMKLNPLAVIIDQVRRILLLGQPPQWLPLLAALGVGWAVFQTGFIWFMKTKRGFSDVL